MLGHSVNFEEKNREDLTRCGKKRETLDCQNYSELLVISLLKSQEI